VNEQTENLTRVKSRIAGAVVEFCRSRLRSKFTMTEWLVKRWGARAKAKGMK
jgi:hypothetical protein